MNKTTILNELIKIQETKKYNNIDNIINELKLDIFSESKDFSSNQKTAQKKALAFLKKVKSHNEILKYCKIIDNVQYFTDSFIAFKMKTIYQLPETEKDYPNINTVFENTEKNNNYILSYDLNTFLKKLKSKQYTKNDEYDCFKIDNIEIWFDVKKLKSIIEILGTAELSIVVDKKAFSNILFIDKKTNNKAILCPVRHPKK